MNILGNLIWLIFGGFLAALCYFFGGLVLCATIIGIPWGLQCFKLAGFIIMPFGLKVVSDSSNSGCLATLANIVWIICGGLASAIIHVLMGVLLSITTVSYTHIYVYKRQHPTCVPGNRPTPQPPFVS